MPAAEAARATPCVLVESLVPGVVSRPARLSCPPNSDSSPPVLIPPNQIPPLRLRASAGNLCLLLPPSSPQNLPKTPPKPSTPPCGKTSPFVSLTPSSGETPKVTNPLITNVLTALCPHHPHQKNVSPLGITVYPPKTPIYALTATPTKSPPPRLRASAGNPSRCLLPSALHLRPRPHLKLSLPKRRW